MRKDESRWTFESFKKACFPRLSKECSKIPEFLLYSVNEAKTEADKSPKKGDKGEGGVLGCPCGALGGGGAVCDGDVWVGVYVLGAGCRLCICYAGRVRGDFFAVGGCIR